MIDALKSTDVPQKTDMKKVERREFTEIKPQSEMSISDARSYFDNVFQNMRNKEADAVDGFTKTKSDGLTEKGKAESANDAANKSNEYRDLNSMKKELGKTYSEIKEDKPPNSPNIAKWCENGGTIRVEDIDGKQVWTYTDSERRSVQYIDGKVKFPPEAKHPVIGDIRIGEFTGDRTKDKQLYLETLEEEYGLTEIPEGYALHHDTENGVLQLVRMDYHKEFTHAGGHSMYKGDE